MDTLKGTPTKPLSTHDLRALNSWLKKLSNISVFEVHGFICAVVCCPTNIALTTWLLNLLPNFTLDSETQSYFTMLNQLHTDIATHFSHYEVVFPLVDFSSASPFEANKLSLTQRDHLALWCHGYLRGIKQIPKTTWQSLKQFNCLKLALRILENEEAVTDILDLDNEFSINSSQVDWIVDDMIESLPVLLGMIYDQACENAGSSKENNKPKKTDINLLYHFRSGKIRTSLPDSVYDIQ